MTPAPSVLTVSVTDISGETGTETMVVDLVGRQFACLGFRDGRRVMVDARELVEALTPDRHVRAA